MTCSSGASVKSGVSPTAELVVSRSLWEQLTGTPSSWLDGILDTFTPSVIKVADLCALNPADPADLTVTDIAAALSGNPLALLEAEQWAKKKLSYYAFTQVCVCNGASSPCYSIFGRPIPTLPDSATNGATVYDLGMKFHCIAACDVTAFGYNNVSTSGSPNSDFKLWDLTLSSLLWTQTVAIPNSSAHEVSATVVSTLVPGHDYALTLRFGSGWTWLIENAGFGGSTNADISSTSRIDNYSSGAGAPTREFSGLAVGVQPIVCPAVAAPAAPTVPTQPTDVVLPPDWTCATACDIMIRLQQLSDRLDWLRRDVQLIQRQAVPFGYIAGTPATGLTGHGTIAVQGILGVSVQLTHVPAGWGSTSDVPRRLIPKVGSLVFATSDGNTDEQQLHYDTELILGISGAVTSVEYTFRPGFVATLTTLTRES